MFFWLRERKKSLEEIFFKEWLGARNQSSDLRRNLYGNKIFKKILTENALEYLAFGEGFYGGSPYRLDILTIILKKIIN